MRPSIGELIDQLHALRESRRALEEEVGELVKQASILEATLMEQMAAQNVSKATGNKATVSISESVKPNVENWDSFYDFIRKNNYFHLLERRPSVTGCPELLEQRGMIPGVVPFVHKKLNLRTV